MTAAGTGVVAILAGGAGTRLRSRSGTLPKPMVPVAGRPVLEYQIAACAAAGLVDIVLLVHHAHEAIAAHFGDGSRFGVRLRFQREDTPRGTAGALRDALPLLASTFVVLYGDTFFDVDLAALRRAHDTSGADATLFLHPNDHPHDSDLVALGSGSRVTALLAPPHPQDTPRANLVNAALYVVRGEAIRQHVPVDGKADLARDTFPAMLAAGAHLHGHVSVEYIKDMGTPERLDKVEADIATGLPARMAAGARRATVFLDRDGTLNQDVGHLADWRHLTLLPGVAAAVRRLNRNGRLAVVVTNQPVLARGELDMPGLAHIHARMDQLLGLEGAFVDRVYWCPHHPDSGFPGEVAALKRRCECRKPAPGMIDAACRDLLVDRRQSWMVGDATADIAAGQAAGVRTVLLETGQGGRDGLVMVEPDHVAADLAEAVDWILVGHRTGLRRLVPLAPRLDTARLVLLGGLSRSGKTTVARLLAELAGASGRSAHVLALDGWLKPVTHRHERVGVAARFQLEEATAALASVLAAPATIQLPWPRHDRHTGRLSPGAVRLIQPDDLLLVEGVPALLHQELRAMADMRLHLRISEDLRQRRFVAEYRRRGRAETDIDALWQSRAADETPVVEAAAAHADTILDWSLPA